MDEGVVGRHTKFPEKEGREKEDAEDERCKRVGDRPAGDVSIRNAKNEKNDGRCQKQEAYVVHLRLWSCRIGMRSRSLLIDERDVMEDGHVRVSGDEKRGCDGARNCDQRHEVKNPCPVGQKE